MSIYISFERLTHPTPWLFSAEIISRVWRVLSKIAQQSCSTHIYNELQKLILLHDLKPGGTTHKNKPLLFVI